MTTMQGKNCGSFPILRRVYEDIERNVYVNINVPVFVLVLVLLLVLVLVGTEG